MGHWGDIVDRNDGERGAPAPDRRPDRRDTRTGSHAQAEVHNCTIKNTNIWTLRAADTQNVASVKCISAV